MFQCCSILESLSCQPIESSADELFCSPDIINALCSRLDDSREVIRQGGARILNSVLSIIKQTLHQTGHNNNGGSKESTDTKEVTEDLGALMESISQQISRRNLSP